jgi:hypothetical protein
MGKEGGIDKAIQGKGIYPTGATSQTEVWGSQTAPEQKWAVGPSSTGGQTTWC